VGIRTGLARVSLVATAAALMLCASRDSAIAQELRGIRTDLSLGGSVLRSFARPDGRPVDRVGVGVSVLVDLRLGQVLAGVSADVTTTIYNQHESFAGVNFGYASGDRAELTVLGEVGAHVLRNVGRGPFAEVETRHVLLPAAGLRFGLHRRRGPGQPDFGFWLFARADFGRHVVRVVGVDCEFGCGEVDGAYRVGGFSGGAAFRMVFGGG
jgi:hypothetical protein